MDKDEAKVRQIKDKLPKKEIEKKKSKFIAAHDDLKIATSGETHRRWTRGVIVIAALVVVHMYSTNKSRETQFALVSENLPLRIQKFNCSATYESEIKQYPLCVPKKCGRLVADNLVEPKESEMLLDLARRIITKAGSSGGASILDIHSGALSYEGQFINIYSMPILMQEMQEEHLNVYNLVQTKIKKAIAQEFGIPDGSIYLTHPTFFSRITNVTAKTKHDEYWHEHVDKETYPSFHYTSLLYLTSYGKDFEGGRFIFLDGFDKNRTFSSIEPKVGRVNAFTSGAENRHHVDKVLSGERYAITISFTCDHKLRMKDPKIKLKH